MSRARLLAYAPVQLRDFVIHRGIPILLVGAFVGLQLFVMARLHDAPGTVVEGLVMQAIQAVSVPFVLIALAGIVSSDRRHGYYRFLFSKPLSVTGYYLQLLVVDGVGLMMCVGLLVVLFQLFVHPINPIPALGAVFALYLGLAGIALFVSAYVRGDWAVVAGIWIAATILQNAWGERGDWHRFVLRVLPPVGSYYEIVRALGAHASVSPLHVVWLIGYSTIFLLLGLMRLQRRAFAG